MKKISFFILFVFCFSLSSFMNPPKEEWKDLLKNGISQWETYLSYSFKNGYSGKQPLDENGKPLSPVGYNNDKTNVFSLTEEEGEPVIHVSGEIYGCIFTKQEFENYHLTLKVKWSENTYEPRKKLLKDSGLLYHSVGEAGGDYWRSWMLSQEFQIMEGHMGDYWSVANSGIDVRAFLPEGSMNTVAGHKQPFLSIGAGSKNSGFCLRSVNNESPENKWTTLELICLEDKSLHIVNGKVVMVLKNSRYVENGRSVPLTKGKIQLQSEAAEVYFKDIRIKSISKWPKDYAKYFE